MMKSELQNLTQQVESNPKLYQAFLYQPIGFLTNNFSFMAYLKPTVNGRNNYKTYSQYNSTLSYVISRRRSDVFDPCLWCLVTVITILFLFKSKLEFGFGLTFVEVLLLPGIAEVLSSISNGRNLNLNRLIQIIRNLRIALSPTKIARVICEQLNLCR